ncbi:class I SAM-dependent methyltransferase [Teredinibacter purpureus]|uniref:class I SAM-dependent methyltransferase n=1 Tax=Teredinibacter purpureus TaxID=2731756 RepID=UPI0005F7CD69|nr:class I SAM-dependent methyltransferase [Teredinibacter purpureus]
MVRKLLVTIGTASALIFGAQALAGSDTSVAVKVNAAMSDSNRPEKHVVRDANRKPLETLEFFGLNDSMKVVELIPGGGWYTRLLAPVLRDNGKLYVAYGAGWMGDLLQQPDFTKVTLLAPESKLHKPEGERFYALENVATGVTNVDMVLTFRNYHNFDEQSRQRMNDEAYKMLKEGGIYGVVDHTRRHLEPLNGENGRRFDPVLAIKEIQAAGFELVDFSDLHYQPVDALEYEVGHKDVTGKTDRWTLKFKKVSK